MQESAPPIRVVVADDSAVMRRLIRDALHATGRIEVVAGAADGDDAIERCAELQPDVLTLDLSMPRTTGIDVLARLRAARSTVRVVVVSAFSSTLVERALDVLDAGAVDLVSKPKVGAGFDDFAEQVATTVMAAAAVPPTLPAPRPPATSRAGGPSDQRGILVIISSTGGPRALGDIVPLLDPDLVAGGVIVQHMPEGFTDAMSRRLDAATALTVREAVDGDQLAAGTLLVAPAGHHLRFREGRARLDDGAPIGGLRPRADLTIRDLAAQVGERLVLVVLTGMGNDGLGGARATRDAGGTVLTQSESDCVVYGMPRHVVEHGLANAEGTRSELPGLIERALAARRGESPER
jgi:two-component system chemotaxis response regulator CheB